MNKFNKFRSVAGFKAQPEKKIFYFFETIAHSVFVVIVGLFFTIFLAVTGASLLFLNPIYNQIVIFSLLGIICFSVSYKYFLRVNGHFLRNLTYENFLISRKKLISWAFWTFNFYFLFCWFILIVLGSSNGFNINFPTSDSKGAFIIGDGKTTKILGFVLLCVHMFILVLSKFIIYYWDRILTFATKDFEKRKKVLEVVRNRAKQVD